MNLQAEILHEGLHVVRVVTPYRDTVQKSLTWILILMLSLRKNVWCSNNYYFMRFIDSYIAPFTELT